MAQAGVQRFDSLLQVGPFGPASVVQSRHARAPSAVRLDVVTDSETDEPPTPPPGDGRERQTWVQTQARRFAAQAKLLGR
jgi:hypothetical protein